DRTYPIKGGEQDRNSAIWQLISIARAAPARFKPGSSWKMPVVSHHDVDIWIFKVTKRQKISTPLGELDALHVVQTKQDKKKSQQVEIWLVPSLEWYPARLRYTDPDGDFIEQTLTNVERTGP